MRVAAVVEDVFELIGDGRMRFRPAVQKARAGVIERREHDHREAVADDPECSRRHRPSPIERHTRARGWVFSREFTASKLGNDHGDRAAANGQTIWKRPVHQVG